MKSLNPIGKKVIIKALMLSFKFESNRMQNWSFDHSSKKKPHRIIESDRETNSIKDFNF